MTDSPTPPPSSAEARTAETALAEALAKMTPGAWKLVRAEPCAAMPEEEHWDFFREVAETTQRDTPHGAFITAHLDRPPRCINIACANFSQADAEGIVAMRNTLPAVLASLAAARDRAEAMEARLQWSVAHMFGYHWLNSDRMMWHDWESGGDNIGDAELATHDGTPESRWQATLDALDQARKGEGK